MILLLIPLGCNSVSFENRFDLRNFLLDVPDVLFDVVILEGFSKLVS